MKQLDIEKLKQHYISATNVMYGVRNKQIYHRRDGRYIEHCYNPEEDHWDIFETNLAQYERVKYYVGEEFNFVQEVHMDSKTKAAVRRVIRDRHNNGHGNTADENLLLRERIRAGEKIVSQRVGQEEVALYRVRMKYSSHKVNGCYAALLPDLTQIGGDCN